MMGDFSGDMWEPKAPPIWSVVLVFVLVAAMLIGASAQSVIESNCNASKQRLEALMNCKADSDCLFTSEDYYSITIHQKRIAKDCPRVR